jgi:undecaprenyl-diphosphatase
MDTILQAVIMGIVQGLTEFLPISSSGHLVLLPEVAGWTDPLISSLAFSVVLHLGTLLALLIYFWRDWVRLVPAGLATIRDRSFRDDPDRRLAWMIVATMPPAIVAGVLLNDFFESPAVRQPILVAGMLVVGAAILWTADRLGRRTDEMDRLGFGGAFFIGGAQAVALVPGISRSGISISAGLALGLTREAAARFSFLMAAPIIAGAGAWETRKLLSGESGVPIEVAPLFAGFVASLVSGLVAITWLLRYLRSHPMTVFVVYRLILAAAIVAWFLAA